MFDKHFKRCSIGITAGLFVVFCVSAVAGATQSAAYTLLFAIAFLLAVVSSIIGLIVLIFALISGRLKWAIVGLLLALTLIPVYGGKTIGFKLFVARFQSRINDYNAFVEKAQLEMVPKGHHEWYVFKVPPEDEKRLSIQEMATSSRRKDGALHMRLHVRGRAWFLFTEDGNMAGEPFEPKSPPIATNWYYVTTK